MGFYSVIPLFSTRTNYHHEKSATDFTGPAVKTITITTANKTKDDIMKKTLYAALIATPVLFATPVLAEPPGGPGQGEGRFAEADANGDGAISREEFVAQREAHFTDADANQDGLISFDESMAAKKEKMEGDSQHGKGPKGPEGDMFIKHDIDGDGFISLAEVEVFSDRVFRDMDSNLDGRVTLLEAKAAMREHFAKRSSGRE